MGFPVILEKQPYDSRVYAFDFSANMGASDTISSIASLTSSPAGLTVSAATISGQKVLVRLSGGTTDTSYKQTCRIITSASDQLEMDGILRVINL